MTVEEQFNALIEAIKVAGRDKRYAAVVAKVEAAKAEFIAIED